MAIAALLASRGLQRVPFLNSPFVRALSTTVGLAIFSYVAYRFDIAGQWKSLAWAGCAFFTSLAWYTNFPVLKLWKPTQRQVNALNRAGFVAAGALTVVFILTDSKPPFASVLVYRILLAGWLSLALATYWVRTRLAAFGGADTNPIGELTEQEAPSRLAAVPDPPPAPALNLQDDAVDRIIVEGRSHMGLTILASLPEQPIMYPIRVRNTRPTIVEIIGYAVTVFWDGKTEQQVNWAAPTRATSNGIGAQRGDNNHRLVAIGVPPDSFLSLDVPVNPRNVKRFPAKSPIWGAKGTITVRSGGRTRDVGFDLTTDGYQLQQDVWFKTRTDAGDDMTEIAYR